MIVYLRVDVIEGLDSFTAYNSVNFSPSYVWRYTNYQEGYNYLRTYVHRSFIRNSKESLSIGIF